MTQRVHGGTFTSKDGFIGTGSDGTALPVLRAKHMRVLATLAALPSVQRLPPLRDAIDRLRHSNKVLDDADVHFLWRAAHHPDFKGEIGRTLAAAANIHRAAGEENRAAEGEAMRASQRKSGSLSPAQLEKDIARITDGAAAGTIKRASPL